MAEYAYVRVSTKEQRLDRQLNALPKTIPPENIFKEKESGKNFKSRHVWNALMLILREGDTLYIKSLDRLGRNYREMGIVWKDLMEKGVSICVLDMPILDTRNCNDLMMRVISDIVFTLFSYIAENERETIRARQRDGIVAAKQRGVRFGRHAHLISAKEEASFTAYEAGKGSMHVFANQFGISQATYRRNYHAWKDGLPLPRENTQTYPDDLKRWTKWYEKQPAYPVKPCRNMRPLDEAAVEAVKEKLDIAYIQSAPTDAEKCNRQIEYFPLIQEFIDAGLYWQEIADLYGSKKSTIYHRYQKWLNRQKGTSNAHHPR